MPAVLRYVSPLEHGRNHFQAQVVVERTERQRSYKEGLKYYLGKHDDAMVYDPDEDPVDDNVTINLVKMTAERTATFLFSKIPVVELDNTSVEPTEEEEWVVKFIDANGGLALLNKWVLRGFLSGHSFIQLKPPRKKNQRDTYPRISLLDPLSVTIYWNAEDVDEVFWYEVRALVGKQVHIYDYVHNLEKDTWTIYHYQSVARDKGQLDTIVETVAQQVYEDYVGAIDRTLFGDDGWKLVAREEHPDVGIPPIIETPHLPHPTGRYGQHEVGLKDLQDTINLIASLRTAVSRESGEPVDVILGAGVADVENKNNIWVVDSPNASVVRLQLKGDLVSLSSTLAQLIETYLAISRVVLLKGEAKDLQRVTNAAVRTLFLDQIAKNQVLQASYGSSFKLIIQLGLKMSGLKTAGEDFDPKIKFANPLPTDFTELANQLQIITNIGAISKRTVATQMDLDWAFESITIKAETELDMENQRAQMELEKEFTPEPAEGGGFGGSKPPSGKKPEGGNKPKAKPKDTTKKT